MAHNSRIGCWNVAVIVVEMVPPDGFSMNQYRFAYTTDCDGVTETVRVPDVVPDTDDAPRNTNPASRSSRKIVAFADAEPVYVYGMVNVTAPVVDGIGTDATLIPYRAVVAIDVVDRVLTTPVTDRDPVDVRYVYAVAPAGIPEVEPANRGFVARFVLVTTVTVPPSC